MTPSPARLKFLASINEHLDRCERDRISGELVIRIAFSRGGVNHTRIERTEKLTNGKKSLDNLEIFSLSDKH